MIYAGNSSIFSIKKEGNTGALKILKINNVEKWLTVSFILSAVAGLLTRRHYLIKFFGNGGIMIVEGVGWVPIHDDA